MSQADTIPSQADPDPLETAEWIDSLRSVLENQGPARVSFLLSELSEVAHREGVELPFTATTPYINTIPADHQPPYPGNRELERRIKSIIRWNAMAMVTRANRAHDGIGVDLELLDLVEQRPVADLEQLRRPGPIASGALKRAADELLFERPGRLLYRELVPERHRRLPRPLRS